MTLDLEKFISNSIKMQAKIQHLDISTKTVKKIPASVKDMIIDDYGDNYLEDADYVSFFWGAIGKDQIEKLFNVVDKALGKSANKLTSTDFKKINFEDGSAGEIDDEEVGIEDDEDIDAEVEVEDDIEDVDDDIDDEDSEDDSLDEDDEENEMPPQKTSYFFLKITLK